MKKTVIVDLDGTLALNGHRYYLIDAAANKAPDWDGYFLACSDDLPNLPVINTVLALFKAGYRIQIFSARGEIAKQHTLVWLKEHGIPYHDIKMREKGCYTPDEQLKKAWLLSYYPNYLDDILLVIDDRTKVVNMWRSLGLTCFQVAEGDF